MGDSERVWDGDRFAVTHFIGHAPLPEFKIWDKLREIHVRTFQYIPGEDDSKERTKQHAINNAERLEKEFVDGS